jgi:hypothetical protein
MRDLARLHARVAELEQERDEALLEADLLRLMGSNLARVLDGTLDADCSEARLSLESLRYEASLLGHAEGEPAR